MTATTETSPRSRRLPASYFAASYAEHLLSITALVVAGLISRQHAESWVSGWAWVVIVLLLCTRIGDPIYTWSSLRFSFSSRGVWVSTGVLTRRTRFAPWDTIAAVEVDAPWCYRIFKMSRVTLLQGGEQPSLALPAVDRMTAFELVELSRTRTTSTAPGPGGLAAAPRPVYRASVGDLLIASLIYGKFITLGATAAAVVLDGLEKVGLLPAVSQITAAGPVVVALAAAPCLALGALITVVRFAGLATTVREDAVVLSYGLFSTRERVVSASAVVGVELRRNLLEMALGRVRLSLITIDSAARLGSNLVLPSLREDVVARMLTGSFLSHIPSTACRPLPRRALVTAAVTLAGTCLVAATAALGAARALEAPPIYAIGGFVALFAALHWSGSTAGARLQCQVAAGAVTVTTLYGSFRQKVLKPRAIHLVGALGIGGQPLVVRLHYYAGRPRALTLVRFTDVQLQELAEAVATRARSGAVR